MKRTLEEKLKYARMHVEEGVPIYEIDQAALKYCCTIYRKWGEKAFKVNEKRRKYSREMQLEAIHEIIPIKHHIIKKQ